MFSEFMSLGIGECPNNFRHTCAGTHNEAEHTNHSQQCIFQKQSHSRATFGAIPVRCAFNDGWEYEAQSGQTESTKQRNE